MNEQTCNEIEIEKIIKDGFKFKGGLDTQYLAKAIHLYILDKFR